MDSKDINNLLDQDTIKKIKEFEENNPDKIIQIEESNIEEVDNRPSWQLKTVECRECGKVFKGDYNKQNRWVSPWKMLAGHVLANENHEDSKRWAIQYLKEHGHLKNW